MSAPGSSALRSALHHSYATPKLRSAACAPGCHGGRV